MKGIVSFSSGHAFLKPTKFGNIPQRFLAMSPSIFQELPFRFPMQYNLDVCVP